MNENFRHILDTRLDAFRAWSRDRPFRRCRLIQYCGAECLGGIDFEFGAAKKQIEGLLGEGFSVDWQEHGGLLYLVAWDPPGLGWSWPNVFAERHLDDPDARPQPR